MLVSTPVSDDPTPTKPNGKATRRPRTRSPIPVIQVNIRTIPPKELRSWRKAAGRRGLSKWLREAAREKLERATLGSSDKGD